MAGRAHYSGQILKIWIAFWTAFLLGLCVTDAPANQTAPLSWYTSWDLGLQAATAKKQPVIAFVFSRKALQCKQMVEGPFRDPHCMDLMRQFILVAVHESDNRDICRDWQVFRAPTIIFFDASGKEIDRAVGFKDSGWISHYMANVLATYGPAATDAVADFERGGANVLEPAAGRTSIRLVISAPESSKVSVVGDFNDWIAETTPMTRRPTGEWDSTIYLGEGVYQYLFLLDNGEYVRDLRNPQAAMSPINTINSVLIVGNPKTSPIIRGEAVTFIRYDEDAERVEVAGDFSNWSPMPMYRNADDPSMWGLRLQLPRGIYSYKYLVDGEWILDPENYLPREDDAGHVNSTFSVD